MNLANWIPALVAAGSVVAAGTAWFIRVETSIADLERPGPPEVATILPDAVLAFAGDCPDGWVPYLPATGRMLIGAGTQKEAPFGDGLAVYELEDFDGAEEIALSASELPPHRHDFRISYAVEPGAREQNMQRVFSGHDELHGRYYHDFNTGSTGEGEPHENMPPYIALQFCTPET